jgi:hypothetical protein
MWTLLYEDINSSYQAIGPFFSEESAKRYGQKNLSSNFRYWATEMKSRDKAFK